LGGKMTVRVTFVLWLWAFSIMAALTIYGEKTRHREYANRVDEMMEGLLYETRYLNEMYDQFFEEPRYRGEPPPTPTNIRIRLK